MKKYIAIATLLAAGAACANAGTAFYWVSDEETKSTEFGAKVDKNGATKTNWRNASSGNVYVQPVVFDSYDAWMNATEATCKISVGYDAEGETIDISSKYSGGVDLNIAWASNKTFTFDTYYGANTLTNKENNTVGSGYTFSFGETGAFATSYQMTLGDNAKIKVALADSAVQTTRYLLNTVVSASWNSISYKNLTFEVLGGYSLVSDNMFSSEAEAKAAVGAGEAAFFTVLNGSNVKSIGVVYQSVPEPSAFGMLAGLGALALVASRRRRK